MATKKKAHKAVAAKKVIPARKVVTKATPKKAVTSKTTAKKQAALPAKPASEKKAITKAPAANKPSTLSKIADLQAQVDELKRDAAGELKEQLAAARKAVLTLENELASLSDGSAVIKRHRRG